MGSLKNDGVERRKIRKKLREWGMPEDEIELCIAQVRERQTMKRYGDIPIDAPLCTRASYVRLLRQRVGSDHNAAVLHLGDDYEPESDKGFKPTKVDSVLTGVARATGQTAKAVKRRKTITKFQYDNQEA